MLEGWWPHAHGWMWHSSCDILQIWYIYSLHMSTIIITTVITTIIHLIIYQKKRNITGHHRRESLTHQIFCRGGVSGGHLSAECLLGSMFSTETCDDPFLAGSWRLGCRQKSRRAEGKKDRKTQLTIILPNEVAELIALLLLSSTTWHCDLCFSSEKCLLSLWSQVYSSCPHSPQRNNPMHLIHVICFNHTCGIASPTPNRIMSAKAKNGTSSCLHKCSGLIWAWSSSNSCCTYCIWT